MILLQHLTVKCFILSCCHLLIYSLLLAIYEFKFKRDADGNLPVVQKLSIYSYHLGVTRLFSLMIFFSIIYMYFLMRLWLGTLLKAFWKCKYCLSM